MPLLPESSSLASPSRDGAARSSTSPHRGPSSYAIPALQNLLHDFGKKERTVDHKAANMENFTFDREKNWRNVGKMDKDQSSELKKIS